MKDMETEVGPVTKEGPECSEEGRSEWSEVKGAEGGKDERENKIQIRR